MNINIIFAASILIASCCTHPMETNQITQYLLQPEEYANFRLTRPYGKKFQSNFDCLPTEVFTAFTQDLRKALTDKFKHEMLKHKYELNPQNLEPLWQDIPFAKQELKIFEYHDGKCFLVPGIADYAMWDDRPGLYWASEISKDNSKIKTVLLRTQLKSEQRISLHGDLDEFQKGNKTLSCIVKENQSIVTCLPLEGIRHYSMSSNSNWLACSLLAEGHTVSFLNVNDMEFAAGVDYQFESPIRTLCSAHHSAFFATCSEDELLLTWPEKKKSYLCQLPISKPAFVEFSPDDKHLCIHDGNTITVYELGRLVTETLITLKRYFSSRIQKICFLDDASMVIALQDGQLIFWDYTSHSTTKNHTSHLSWLSKDTNIHHLTPLMTWSKKNNLLLSLDPRQDADHTDTLKIRKATNGKFIASYTFSPNNPVAMGLTKDERSMIFRDTDNNLSRLDLYDESEYRDDDFIAKKANFYQLCSLWHTYKTGKAEAKIKSAKTDVPLEQKKLSFMDILRLHIASYQKE